MVYSRGYGDIIFHKILGLTRNVFGNSHGCCRISSFTRNKLFLDRKFLLTTGIFYQNRKATSCEMKDYQCLQKSFLWHEMSSFGRKFLLLAGNFFLLEEIPSYTNVILCLKNSLVKILPLTLNFFL